MDSSGTLSNEACILWGAARGLAREAASVSAPLLFFTDPARTPEPWRTAERLPAHAGVGAGVVYRHFGAADAEAVARRLRAIATERGLVLLIGLDADLAHTVGADGVHLPQRALDQAEVLRARRSDWLLTGAVHSADASIPDALDAVVLSPIFPAGGASGARPVLGVEALKSLARRRPVYALGGVSAATVGALTGSGACGIAGVAAIQSAFAA